MNKPPQSEPQYITKGHPLPKSIPDYQQRSESVSVIIVIVPLIVIAIVIGMMIL